MVGKPPGLITEICEDRGVRIALGPVRLLFFPLSRDPERTSRVEWVPRERDGVRDELIGALFFRPFSPVPRREHPARQ